MIEFDKRHQLTTPNGIISDAGIIAVNELIDAENPLTVEAWKLLNPTYTANFVPRLPADWQWEWIVTKGVYAGTLPKRMARHYFKVHALKCPPTFLERIGNIARQHATEGETYNFDFTKHLTWQAGDFGDAGSCYWGGHAYAREMLMDDNAFAIRFYKADGSGCGRAWIVDRQDADQIYVLFNGYGLGSLTAARVFSLHLGLSYKRISLSNHDNTGGVLYINGGAGYAIGTVDSLDNLYSYDLEMGDPDGGTCESCGRYVDDDDSYTTPEGDLYCESCYSENYRTCDECDETHHHEQVWYIESTGRDVCESCRDRYYSTCERCEEEYHNDDLTPVEDGEETHYYCSECKAQWDTEQAQQTPE